MKILLISFDLHKPNQPSRSLAMGNILSAWRREIPDGQIEHESFDILSPSFNFSLIMDNLHSRWDFSTLDYLAFQVAVWSKKHVQKTINLLPGYGFSGEIILGGYEITGRNFHSLKSSFPKAHHFVRGFGEPALRTIMDQHLSGKLSSHPIIITELNNTIPSPYLDKTIPIDNSITTVSIETKRGCPYTCSYCAHDTVHKRQIKEKPVDCVKEEIDCLIQLGIKKINIIDPVFNCGKHFLEIAKYISELNSQTIFTLQYRLKPNMHEFLEICQKGNIHLEIGIQSLNPDVLQNIGRHDLPDETLELLREVADFVPFEMSVIYGLPGQTLSSIKDTIAKLKGVTANLIRAYPLMLLPGTQLHEEKEKWEFKEDVDELGIPYVRKSKSFSAEDWRKMDQISKRLISDK